MQTDEAVTETAERQNQINNWPKINERRTTDSVHDNEKIEIETASKLTTWVAAAALIIFSSKTRFKNASLEPQQNANWNDWTAVFWTILFTEYEYRFRVYQSYQSDNWVFVIVQ